ncbi:preprotein translocase subunit SecG [Endothiovibrio diazotrophicus]
MLTILLVIQVFVALGLIGFILIQHGKGADMGAAFGAGASATVFGAQGSGSFLTRTTAILAAIFFVNSLVLSLPAVHGRDEQKQSIMDRVKAAQPAVPAIPEDAMPVDDVPGAKVSDVPAAPAAGAEDVPTVPADDAAPAAEADVPAVPAAPEKKDVPVIPTAPVE